MILVDSSGWLEFFSQGPNTDAFAKVLENPERLIVPTVSLYEVFKRLLQQRGETESVEAVAHMMQGNIVDLDASLALSAAKLSTELKLPLADSLILATAREHGATLWTQDADFAGIKGVRYIPKTS